MAQGGVKMKEFKRPYIVSATASVILNLVDEEEKDQERDEEEPAE